VVKERLWNKAKAEDGVVYFLQLFLSFSSKRSSQFLLLLFQKIKKEETLKKIGFCISAVEESQKKPHHFRSNFCG